MKDKLASYSKLKNELKNDNILTMALKISVKVDEGIVFY